MALRTVKVGFVGLGSRGRGLMKKAIKITGTKVVGICDLNKECIDLALKDAEALGERPKVYSSYDDMLSDPKIEAVLITTSWSSHITLACRAMEAGKAVAMEVGPAMSLQECFKLVEVQEKTGVKFMFLENTCYNRDVLLVLNMIKEGFLGEIIHADGCYQHCVTDLVYKEYKAFNDGVPGNERIINRMMRNMEPYPTHDVGPLSKALKINRGNRFISLTAVSSKSRGLNTYIEKTYGKEAAGEFAPLAQGDVVNTILKCAGGETVTLTWNTALPAPASKGFKIYGTNGAYHEELSSIYIEGISPIDEKSPTTKKWESIENYRKKYKHPGWIWFDKNKYMEKYSINPRAHGDADYLILMTFADCIRYDYDTPIDVYDAATWIAVSVLAEQSLALGSQPVFFPDFTNGRWLRRAPVNVDERWNCGI